MKSIREHIDLKKLAGWIVSFYVIFLLSEKTSIFEFEQWSLIKTVFFKICECTVYYIAINLLFDFGGRHFDWHDKIKLNTVRRISNWIIFIYLIAGIYPYGASIFEQTNAFVAKKKKPKKEIEILAQEIKTITDGEVQKVPQTDIDAPILEKIIDSFKKK